VPGTAKTLFVRVLARLLALEFRRIQFTPDLMPTDVIGTTVFNPKTGEFAIRRGPIFAGIVLADEINRTPPKTQSALLEAMEEGRVTIDGETHVLPSPFLVCATQNPIEFEGTYPLPEAQRDRFLVRARTTYPSEREERALLTRVADGFDASDLSAVRPVVDVAALLAARAEVRAVRLTDAVRDYLQTIVARTRESSELMLGASPRAAIALLHAAQAAATIDGRGYVTPDDVKDVVVAVLAHRVLLDADAELDGSTADLAIERIVRAVPVPADVAAPA
jgi:MoxR-like ATPase